MNLAVYYHITFTIKDGKYCMPGFFGVFIDALAQETDKLYFVGHEDPNDDGNDYALSAKNLEVINLGLKTPAWHRDLYHNKILKGAMKKVSELDALIVRSPSPLAPYFGKYLPNNKLFYLIVGDYGAEAESAKAKSLREWIMWKYVAYNARLFDKQVKKHHTMVNSDLLLDKYKGKSKSLFKLNTTTISKKDFYHRDDTCVGDTINLLYAGRIDVMKGLFELLEAVAMVNKSSEKKIVLNIVGWEEAKKLVVEPEMKEKAKELGIEDKVIFQGKKRVGPELFKYYQMADIYVIPSYHEGFPRTIWEAMANSCPVVATKVGGIPKALDHKKNAYLIDPKNVEQIVEGISYLLSNPEDRREMISQARERVSSVTLEEQSQRIIQNIKEKTLG